MKLSYLIIGLTLFGLMMVGNASVVSASRDFGDKWHYFRHQAAWAGIGLVGFIVASRFPHHRLSHYAVPLLGTAIILLLLVLIPGLGVQALGARRWLNLGFTSFQPSELAKLALAIYLAKLAKNRPKFVQFMAPLGILCILIMAQPDLGTTLVILGMGLVTYFGMGGRLGPFALTAPVVVLAILGYVLISPYRLGRLQTFLNPEADPLGSSYQIRQALIGLGSGGVFGIGLGQSRQKFDFLPEATTDSIFAILAEEMGFVGASVLILAFLALGLLGLRISQNASQPFSQSLALSLTVWLWFQAFINLSALVALVPLTGIPLPFISYGGTSLVVNLVAAGILVNIGSPQTGYNRHK